MYKDNNRLSSKFKGRIPLKLSCNLTGKKSTIPNDFIQPPLRRISACISIAE